MAPSLRPFVSQCIIRQRTVAHALQNRRWVSDIRGHLTVQVLVDYLKVWDAVDNVMLQLGVQDQYVWKLSWTGVFSCKSAYGAFFTGSIRFAPW
uniref:Uncharacterized protein n=1 Tax=Arundo donax TaxID=35708 RepID=A0A0A9C4B4_ARUDO